MATAARALPYIHVVNMRSLSSLSWAACRKKVHMLATSSYPQPQHKH